MSGLRRRIVRRYRVRRLHAARRRATGRHDARHRGARRTALLLAGAGLVIVVVVVTRLVAGGSSDPEQDSGRYAGLSDQRLPVRLTASKDRSRLSVDISWIAHCGRMQSAVRPDVLRTVRRSLVRVAADGSFAWRSATVQKGVLYRDRQRFALRGRRAADGTITGTWRAARALSLPRRKSVYGRCSTGAVQFRARPDGSVRLPAPRTDAAGNRVFALPGAPEHVAAGAGGVWALTASPRRGGRSFERTLVQVDPVSGELMSRTLQRSGRPVATLPFAAGEGAAWVAVPGALDVAGAPQRAALTLARLDPRTHALMARPDRRLTGLLREMVVGGGAVWVLVQSDIRRHELLKADPRDGRIQGVVALPAGARFRASRNCFGFENAQMAAGTAGALWITATAAWACASKPLRPRQLPKLPIRSRRLHRIDPRSSRVTRSIAVPHSYERLAASRTGLWGTTCAGRLAFLVCSLTPRPELHRISARDGRPASVTRLPPGRVLGLAATDDAVWISQIGRRSRGGTLLRVDRRTGRLSTVLRFEGAPSPVSIGEGGVWVIDTFARRLFRVPLDPPPGGGSAGGA